MNKLDNPIWHSLSETHKDLAVEYEGMKFYHPDYCPFGGFINSDKTEVEEYASLTNNFFVVGNKPNSNDTVLLNNELVCNEFLEFYYKIEMTHQHPRSLVTTDLIVKSEPSNPDKINPASCRRVFL